MTTEYLINFSDVRHQTTVACGGGTVCSFGSRTFMHGNKINCASGTEIRTDCFIMRYTMNNSRVYHKYDYTAPANVHNLIMIFFCFIFTQHTQ